MSTMSAYPVMPPLDPSGGSSAGYPYPEAGMTLRDYFAAKAMQGSLADTEVNPTGWEEHAARWYYKMADAMLKVREEPEQTGDPADYSDVAEFLLQLGWKSLNDAQWESLRDNLGALHELIGRALR